MGGRFYNRPVMHLVLIAALGLLAYSNTFNASFHFDDYFDIAENPILKDLRYFTRPWEGASKCYPAYSALIKRYVGYLSFALNYKAHGLDVRGFHATNIAIHILNGMLLYFLIVLTFRTPCLAGSPLKHSARPIALLAALLFVTHPIQTQAVTYIVQRLASMATMFYLGSLVFYIKWRLMKAQQRSSAAEKDRHSRESGNPGTSTLKTRKTLDSRLRGNDKIGALLLYCASIVSAVLAMKTKEIAFTLPIAIALYEFSFFGGSIRKRALYLIPLFLTMLIIPLTILGMGGPLGALIGETGPAMPAGTSRADYLFTEFRVIVTYLRLLVLPVGQNLDYDYPIYNSFFEPQVFLSFLFLLGILGLGVFLFRRSRTDAAGRLIAFGIFWFFLALSVESSIIPLHVIFEHRAYLPSVGFFCAFATAAFMLLNNLKGRNIRGAATVLLMLVPLVVCYPTYARNAVWMSEVSLWEDVVKKSPQKARGHYNLGNAYYSEGLADKAIERYRAALKLRPDYKEAHLNLGVVYESRGLHDEAIAHYQAALEPGNARAYNNLGVAYAAKGLLDRAVEHYLIALGLDPDDAEVHNNLGVAYARKGLLSEAEARLRAALVLKPDYAEAHNNLGIVHASLGSYDRAIEHYLVALQIEPDDAETHNNLGVAYRTRGSTDRAIGHYLAAIGLDPDYASAYFNLGLAYLEKGLLKKARRELDNTLKIDPGHKKARRLLNELNGGE